MSGDVWEGHCSEEEFSRKLTREKYRVRSKRNILLFEKCQCGIKKCCIKGVEEGQKKEKAAWKTSSNY